MDAAATIQLTRDIAAGYRSRIGYLVEGMNRGDVDPQVVIDEIAVTLGRYMEANTAALDLLNR